MAKDPFSGPRGRKLSIGRVAFGVLLVGSVTFALGYYLPLSDAHALLAKEHRALGEAANGTKAQLDKTTEQLLETKGERDELSSAMKKVELERQAAKKALSAIAQGVESKLASSIKAKVVVVEPTDKRVALLIDESRIFRPNEVQPHRPGQTLLCTIAKGLRELNVEYDVGLQSHVDKVADPILKKNYPTPWELTAARAGAAARTMVQCGLPDKWTHAVGLGYALAGPDADKKSTGEMRIVLSPR